MTKEEKYLTDNSPYISKKRVKQWNIKIMIL